MHFFHLQSRRQWRWFWTGFSVSLIFILFITAFLYVACGHPGSVHEPVLSAAISSDAKHPSSSGNTLTINFLGLQKELAVSELNAIKNKLCRLYAHYGLLIPAKYRAAGGLLWLLFKILNTG